MESPTFDALPLSKEVRRAIDELGYASPTPVQIAVFEPASRGKDMVVQARTGTGKTAAFGLPIVDSLVKRSLRAAQALILAPTRELALQVSAEISKLGKYRDVSVVAIYGGAAMGPQVEALAGGAQVIAGTPGRVLDHLRRGTLDPSNIRILVLDEADEMLSMGFARELHAILEQLPKDRQGLFFSATVPPEIERLALNRLKEPEFVTLSSDQVGALEIEHYVYHVPGDKREAILKIIDVENPESAIIFCNTKDETERVAELLQSKGYAADWLNGDLEQRDRERVMAATREGKLRFLVCTDVASRGIDISHLTHVVNFDFPESTEAYVHRTGRTGRAGRTGTAISLVSPKDIGNLYLLRLTYKLRPVERKLPSDREVKTRSEQDVVDMFVQAFSEAGKDEDDLAIAQRLLTHDAHLQIIAGMIRTHLGAKSEGATRATEERRGRMPPKVAPEKVAPEKVERVEAEALPRTVREAPSPRAASPRPERSRERSPERSRERSPERTVSDAATAANATHAANATDAATVPADAPLPGATMAQDTEPRGTGGTGDRGPSRERRERREGGRGEEQVPPTRPTRRPVPLRAEGAAPEANGEANGAGRTHEKSAETAEPARDADDAFAQMFVNVGRRDGVKPSDLVELLTGRGGLAESDIGPVRMRDRMTFVGIRPEVFDATVAKLAGEALGGRELVVERAKVR
jgi:ATP-dependent RNA helicase DeaD